MNPINGWAPPSESQAETTIAAPTPAEETTIETERNPSPVVATATSVTEVEVRVKTESATATDVESSTGHDPLTAETCVQDVDGSETQVETSQLKVSVRTAGGRRVMLKSFGDYEVLSEIARGGMGVVYRARQTRLNRVVAVKMILQGQLASDGDIQRFYSEAEAAARLEHPGIVPIYEVGEHDGQHYFSMGFVDGESLADRVRRGPLAAREAASLVRDVAEAIEYAHQHGIVHRDLKPGNILLTRDGYPRVTDFGLAKAIEHDSGLTASGQVLGTPSYMPPEQAAGRIRDVGPLSDLYSLGAVLYCLLVGRPPFQGVTVMETLKHVVESPPVSPRMLNPSVDRDLETICLKCLEKTPEDRLASAGELAEELRRYLAGEPIRSRPVNAATRLWRWCKRKPLAAALVAAVVVLGVAIGAGVSLAKSAARQREIGTLQTEFERLIDNAQLSSQWLQATDELAARIAALQQQSEQTPVEHVSRITEAYAELIRKDLKRPKLSNDSAEILRSSIKLLKERAPSLGAELLTQLEGRLTDWVIDFELSVPQAVSTTLTGLTDDKIAPLQKADETAASKSADALSEQLAKIFGASKVQLANGAFVPTHSDLSTTLVVNNAAKTNSELAADFKYVVAPQTVTLMPCRDDIELAAVFGPEWRTATEVGLSLNAAAGRGYDFVIRVLDASARSSAASEDGADPIDLNTKQFVAELRRHGQPLLKRVIAADSLPTGPLALRARRQRGELEFQVGLLEPIRFTDPFALATSSPGVFAVRWPAQVTVMSLTAQHRPRAVAGSKLEQGDELFDRGKFVEAADKYRQQMTEADDEATQQEARYKLGATLMALQRPAEADEVLAPLLANEQCSWAALSGMQMLVSALRRKQADEADGIIEILSSRFRFEELAVIVPMELRDEILKSYSQAFLSIGGMLQFDAKRLQKIERAAAIDRMLSSDGLGDFFNQNELVRVYRYFGKWPEALKAIEPLLKRNRDGTTMRHFCRILRFLGDSKRAIDEIDASLSGRIPMVPLGSPYHRPLLLLERARAFYVLGNRENCEADLRLVRAMTDRGNIEHYTDAASAAMLGLLLEERGQVAAAVEVWRQGYRQARHLFDGTGKSYDTSVILALMLGSLSGELLEADANEFVRLVSAGDSGGSLVSMATSLVTPQSIAEGMREMWRTPRGKRAARDFAFETIPLRERSRLPVVLLGQTFFRQKGFESVLSTEQDQTLWDFVDQGFAGVLEAGTLKTSQLMQLALTWKGTTNFVGWGGVAPTLPQEYRAKAAWVFGHRFMRLSKPVEAKQFFDIAVKDAPADSLLARLAKQDLELLRQERAKLVVESEVPGAVVVVRRGTETVATIDLRTTSTSDVLLPIGQYEVEISGGQQAVAYCDAVRIPTTATPVPSTRLSIQLPTLATATLRLQSSWREPRGASLLSGIVPTPALLPGIGRWQIKRREPIGMLGPLDWSADETQIAGVAVGRGINLINAVDGTIEETLLGHRQFASRIEWSPDGMWLASVDYGGRLCVWNRKQSRLAFSRGESQGAVGTPTWSPDSQRLAVTTHGGVLILDLEGTVHRKLSTTHAVYAMSWSLDGQRLVCSHWSDHSSLAIWSLDDRGQWSNAPRVIDSPSGKILRHLSWSPDGRLLIAATDGAIEVWETDRWSVLGSRQMHSPLQFFWDTDNRHFFVCDYQPGLSRYDARNLADGKPERIETPNFGGLSAMTRDRQRFVRSGHTSLRLYDRSGATQKTIEWSHPKIVPCSAWSPDGRRLASAYGNRVWLHEVSNDDASPRVGRLLMSHAPDGAELSQVHWSPDGTALAVASFGGSLSLLAPDGTTMVKRVLDSPLNQYQWLPNGQQLVTSHFNGKLRVLSRTGDIRAELAQFQHSIIAVAVDSLGEQVAVATAHGEFEVISLKTRERRPMKLASPAHALLWLPDGKTLAVGSDSLVIVDTSQMKQITQSPNLGSMISGLKWHPEQQSLFVGLRIGSLLEMNTKGEVIRTLRPPTGDLLTLSLHRDQRTVALGTLEGTVELWNIEQAKPLSVLIGTQSGGCLSLSATGEPLGLTSHRPDANGQVTADDLDDLIWIVESESGVQSMLRAAEFFERQQVAFDREVLARLKQESAPREAPAAPLQDLGKLSVPEIQEASGLVASRKYEGVFWTISDSGNPANLYALDETGRVLATYRIGGATNSDWESITLDEHARLFIADTGNAARSALRTIYELAEPDPRAAAESSFAKPIDLTPRRRLTFNAPTPDTDFEASFTVGGQLFLPTKVSSGSAQLYALALPSPSAEVIPQPLTLDLKSVGSIPNANWITDAALHPNGKRLVLVTYSEAIQFDLSDLGSLTTLPAPTGRIRFEAPFIESATFDRSGKLVLLSETGTLHQLLP